MELPKNHPRYSSLATRHRLVEAYESGILATAGLIAHGRGEAFDYIIGEKSIPFALEAERATAAMLLISERPVISVNGNVAVLCPQEVVDLAKHIGAKIEVNLFYKTPERMEKIIGILEGHGASGVLGADPDFQMPGLEHSRGLCCSQGIGGADVVLVPLEDGDRCHALVANGKKVCIIDLNPFSRTSRSATISIMDDVSRAMKNILSYVKETRWNLAERIIAKYDNNKILGAYVRYIDTRLMLLAEKTEKEE